MTAIDHAAEARKRISEAHSGIASGDRGSRKAATLDYLEANAHATLALVEAQQEANEQALLANRLTYIVNKNAIHPEHHEWIEEGLEL